MALSNLTKVQTVGIGSNIEVVGVITTGQFKTGTSNLHSSGVELTNLNVSGIATIGGNVSIGGTLTYQDVTNIDSVGIVTAREGVFLPDNKKLELGNAAGSGDLQLLHDGSRSSINNRTGELRVLANNHIRLGYASASNTTQAVENYAIFNYNGSVDLFYNNTKRFETTDTGAIVTGILTATSFSGDGSNLTGIDTDLVSDTSPQLGGDLASNGNDIVMADNDQIILGSSNDFTMYHDPSGHTFLQDQGNGALRIRSDSEVAIQSYVSGTNKNMAKFMPDGAVELYHNGAKKFETTAHGIVVEDDNPYIVIKDNNTASGTGIIGWIEAQDSSGNPVWKIGNTNDDQNTLFINQRHNASTKFTGAISGDTWEIYGNSGHFAPCNDNTVDIGSSSKRVRNIYTADLHCSNRGSSNDVDGTWGDYTIQEGESDLFLINNRSGKKYKFNLTEVN